MGKKSRFRGSFEVKVDAKGRVRVPSKFLSVFNSDYDSELFVTSLDGGNVLVYPMKVWEQIEARIDSQGVLDPDIDAFGNRVSYWGSETEIDSKGRILIPPDLRKHSKLIESVRILGKTNHLVIWNETEFKEKELSEEFTKDNLHRVSRILNGTPALPDNE